MHKIQLPDNWELTLHVFSFVTRIATIEETRQKEQECRQELQYYCSNFEQLSEEELDILSTLLFIWSNRIINPRIVPRQLPVYQSVSKEFIEWFQQLKSMWEKHVSGLQP